MLIQCYRSYMMPFTEHDPLSIYVQRMNGWFSVGLWSVDYYISEEYAYMLYVYDANIHRLPSQDYLA